MLQVAVKWTIVSGKGLASGSVAILTMDSLEGTQESGNILLGTGNAELSSGSTKLISGNSQNGKAGDVALKAGNGIQAGNVLVASGSSSRENASGGSVVVVYWFE